jgi:membrane protease YdiL (CAAX protease family)
VEDLLFCDSLESRLPGASPNALSSPYRSVLAMRVTAALLVALHDRWAEAFVAGPAFSFLVRRSGRIADAIAAYAAANLIVFAMAVATGNLGII